MSASINIWSSIADIIGVLGFFGSVITYFCHDKKLKQQQKQINEYNLLELKKKEEESKKAYIIAEVEKPKNGIRYIYVHNKGKCVARNLIINTPRTDDVWGVQPKLPIKTNLSPDEKRKIEVYINSGQNELTLHYEWNDEYMIGNKRDQHLDL